MIFSAPGKVLLFGEYAVLSGHPGLVAAVQRRVSCTRENDEALNVVAPGFGHLSRQNNKFVGEDDLPFARALLEKHTKALGRFTLKSDALSTINRRGESVKLGLGGSAATTVALTAALQHETFITSSESYRESIYRAAQNAHRKVQGLGSGADIAASTFGGITQYRWFENGVERLATSDKSLIQTESGLAEIVPIDSEWQYLTLVWTSRSAHTPSLVDAVFSFRDARPNQYHRIMDEIGAAAEDGTRAWCAHDSSGLRDAMRRSGEALRALESGAHVALWTEVHHQLSHLAEERSGALKPTGAGGGDLAWVHFDDESAWLSFQSVVTDEGFLTLTLPIDPQGVTLGMPAEGFSTP